MSKTAAGFGMAARSATVAKRNNDRCGSLWRITREVRRLSCDSNCGCQWQRRASEQMERHLMIVMPYETLFALCSYMNRCNAHNQLDVDRVAYDLDMGSTAQHAMGMELASRVLALPCQGEALTSGKKAAAFASGTASSVYNRYNVVQS